MSFLKALNEAFDNYKCDECNELNESGKHFDLLMALKAARETLQRDGNNNLKAYEIAYQNVLEDYFPDKSWWEVTDCNIFNDLMETRDPEMTEINIIKGIKDDVDESCNESIWGEYKEFNPKDGWTEEDIEFYKTIDWKERNYKEYEKEDDTFVGFAVAYGFGEPKREKTSFVKVYRPNPIYPPYYRPKEDPFKGVVGPMADGRKHNGYDIHDRYETQALYDRLSESKVRDRMTLRKTNESLKVVDEVSLKDFNFRPEAADRLKYLTDDQILQLESALEDMYPEGMTAEQLNEFVWFEDDTIAQILGFEDFDEVMEQGIQR